MAVGVIPETPGKWVDDRKLPSGDEAEIRRAYREASLDGLRRVAPVALVGLIVFATGSGAIELEYFPERWLALLLLNGTYLICGLVHLFVIGRRPDWTLKSTVIATWAVHIAVLVYFSSVHGSAELCVSILGALFMSQVIIYPWNAAGQLGAAIVPVTGFAFGLYHGLQSHLPFIYPMFALLTTVMLTTLGAGRLDRHRFEAFRRSLLLERTAAEQAEERRFIQALLDLARALSLAIGEPQRLASELAEHTRTVVDADWVMVYRWLEDAQQFVLVARAGVPAAVGEEFEAIDSKNHWMMALQPSLKQTGAVDILRSDPDLAIAAPILDRWGIRVMRVQRVAHEERRIGMIIGARSNRVEPFTAGQRRLLEAIATQAAIALENAGLVEAARAGERVKGEFVATISHELRTPLNVILGYTDLILDGTFGDRPADETDALQRVRVHSLQLLDLIQGLLDINRLDARGISVSLSRFTVAELIDKVRESVPDNWQQPTVRLIWPSAPISAVLRSDSAKLEMILRNLIHNALKFTAAGTVTVSTEAVSNQGVVRFIVSDTGPGIRDAERAVIFEMFGQGEGGPRAGGVGLGLYIVKRLAEMLGATIELESELGVGSRFILTIPAEI